MVWAWDRRKCGRGVEPQCSDSLGIMKAMELHNHFMVYGISGPHIVRFVTLLIPKSLIVFVVFLAMWEFRLEVRMFMRGLIPRPETLVTSLMECVGLFVISSTITAVGGEEVLRVVVCMKCRE